MKLISLLFLSVLLIAVAFSSCKKNETVQDVLLSTASMSAKVNDTLWTAMTRVTRHFAANNKFVISGTSSNGQVIVITVLDDAEGTYTSSTSIDSLSAQVGAVWQPDASSPTTNNFVSQSGTVTLTTVDSQNMKVSGTFSFDLINLSTSQTKTITEGKFSDLSYTENSSK